MTIYRPFQTGSDRSTRKMKIAVLGATGPTGQQVVMQALSRGFEVRALVRDPEKMAAQMQHEKLQVKCRTLFCSFSTCLSYLCLSVSLPVSPVCSSAYLSCLFLCLSLLSVSLPISPVCFSACLSICFLFFSVYLCLPCSLSTYLCLFFCFSPCLSTPPAPLPFLRCSYLSFCFSPSVSVPLSACLCLSASEGHHSHRHHPLRPRHHHYRYRHNHHHHHGEVFLSVRRYTKWTWRSHRSW